jgi:histidinol-phosphate aminotransferase
MTPSTTMPKPRLFLLNGPTYTPGKAATSGAKQSFKLSSNESAVGASPSAIAAIAAGANEQHLYPDPDGANLARAIAQRNGLEARRVVTGPGSEAIINWLIQGWADQSDEIVYSAHGFQAYRIRAMSHGIVPVAAPETDMHSDVQALLAAVTPKTRIMFVANPNNPTGTWIGLEELTELRRALRPDVLLVVDEAYCEYVDMPGYASAIRLVNDETPNVVVTRTFSKFFGLAGLRVGWAYVPSTMVAPLGQVRGPFAVSRVALAAAIAALKDDAHQASAMAHNARWRDWLQTQLRGMDFETTDSVGNFVLFKAPGGADAAIRLHGRLAQEGLMCRIADQNGLPDWIRVTVGSESSMHAFTQVMRSLVAETGLSKEGAA